MTKNRPKVNPNPFPKVFGRGVLLKEGDGPWLKHKSVESMDAFGLLCGAG